MSDCQKTVCNSTAFESAKLASKPAYRPWDFGDWSLLILFIFGTLGNGLSILVINKKRMRNTNATLFVTGIAIADTILLFFKLISNMVKIYRINVYDLCVIIQTIPQAAMFVSIWLIMIMSCERMVAVRYPLQVATIFSKFRCKIVISIMVLFFAIFTLFFAICMEHVVKQPYYCQIKGFQNGTCFAYHSYIFPLFKSAFSSWFPSILGIVLNILIVYELYSATKQRKELTNQSPTTRRHNSQANKNGSISESIRTAKFTNDTKAPLYSKIIFLNKEKYSSSENNLELLQQPQHVENSSLKVFGRSSQDSDTIRQVTITSHSKWRCKRIHGCLSALLKPNLKQKQQSKEKQITVMLLTVSLAFILLTMPYNTFELLRKLGFTFKFLKNRTALRFCMFLIDLNHSTNFLIYCASTQRFRNELKAMLCKLLDI